MIELFLSTDGKHTVHVSAETPKEMASLAPKAKELYKKVITEFGTKVQMWEGVMNGNRGGKNNGVGNNAADHGTASAPLCPVHGTSMVKRNGRYGEFWACPTKNADGSWCKAKPNKSTSG